MYASMVEVVLGLEHLPHDCMYWPRSLTTQNGRLHCFLTTLLVEKLKKAPGAAGKYTLRLHTYYHVNINIH